MKYKATVLLMIFLAGCERDRYEIEFCGAGELPTKQVQFVLDMKEHRLFGSDTAAVFEVLSSDVARGFVFPFPLSLPLEPLVASDTPGEWQLGDTMFRAASHGSNPSWILIQATPRDERVEEEGTRYSSVLYSRERGVLAIRISNGRSEYPSGSEFLFCGTGSLHAASF